MFACLGFCSRLTTSELGTKRVNSAILFLRTGFASIVVALSPIGTLLSGAGGAPLRVGGALKVFEAAGGMYLTWDCGGGGGGGACIRGYCDMRFGGGGPGG